MSSQKESGACWHLLLGVIRENGSCLRANNSGKTSAHFGMAGRYNYKTVTKYSIVVPFHNEEENVTELYDRLKVVMRSEEHTSELQSLRHLVCRLLLEKKTQ